LLIPRKHSLARPCPWDPADLAIGAVPLFHSVRFWCHLHILCKHCLHTGKEDTNYDIESCISSSAPPCSLSHEDHVRSPWKQGISCCSLKAWLRTRTQWKCQFHHQETWGTQVCCWDRDTHMRITWGNKSCLVTTV
jgi:hypothetical protein